MSVLNSEPVISVQLKNKVGTIDVLQIWLKYGDEIMNVSCSLPTQRLMLALGGKKSLAEYMCDVQ